MRTCAIGLDAGEWSLIQSLIDAGDLPNLGRLAQNGVARFENPTYRTGLVWQGFLADSAPPRSGVEFDTQSFGAFQVGALPVRPFFDSPRRRVIAIDLPLMSLAQVGNGTYVTAWGAHGAGYPRASKPSGVLTEIDSRFGPHPAFADDQCHWNDPSSVRDLRDRLIAGARTRVEIFDWLTSRDPEWDLFIMALSETHSAGESFWHGVDPTHLLAELPEAAAAKEALLDVYRAVDDTIGRIAQKLPADTALCVFSLHGIKQNTGDIPSSYLLPELLLRLETGNRLIQDPDQDEWRRSGFPAVVPAAGEWPPSALRSFGSESPKRKAIRALKSVMPRPVQDQLRALRARGRSDGDAAFAYGHGVPDESPHPPEEIGTPRTPLIGHMPYQYKEFWPGMRAFVLPTFGDGRVRLNVIGRESRGIVAATDYKRVRDDVVSALMEVRDPRTGRQAVDEVVTPADDPLDVAPTACDIEVYWADAIDSIEHPRAGTIGPFRLGRTGGHTGAGFVVTDSAGVADPSVTAERLPSFIERLIDGPGARSEMADRLQD